MTRTQAIALNNFNHFIGLDSIARELDRIAATQVVEKYPPHSIEKLEENVYSVTLAVAGFNENELSVVVQDNVLKISGKKEAIAEPIEYLHRGISFKPFEKTIPLVDTVEVISAKLEYGLLTIKLENKIPIEKMPKIITIDI